MSNVNEQKPHIFVLPEDYANAEIANGFTLSMRIKDERQIRVLRPAGGWNKVLNSSEIEKLAHNPHRYLILLIDFDEKDIDRRRERFTSAVPDHLKNRVFLLGTKDEPEALRKSRGKSWEAIGRQLAEECFDNNTDDNALWSHDQLRHNAAERERLWKSPVQAILFQ